MKSCCHRLLSPVLDFIYPPVCCTCNASLQAGEDQICTTCWTRFVRVDALHPLWRKMQAKLASEAGIANLVSCYLFEKDNVIQDVIHLLKYKGMKSIGLRLGAEIGARIREQLVSKHIDVIVPVPLHPVRKRERGYNQADILSRGISRVISAPVDTRFLIRKRYTPSQTQLDVHERRGNVRDAFMLNPKKRGEVKDRSFMIVDDVMTTGSTLCACAGVLRACGASVVYAASVALAR